MSRRGGRSRTSRRGGRSRTPTRPWSSRPFPGNICEKEREKREPAPSAKRSAQRSAQQSAQRRQHSPRVGQSAGRRAQQKEGAGGNVQGEAGRVFWQCEHIRNRQRAKELISEYILQWENTWKKNKEWEKYETYKVAEGYITDVKFNITDENISDAILTDCLNNLKAVKKLYDDWMNCNMNTRDQSGQLGASVSPLLTPTNTKNLITELKNSAKMEARAEPGLVSPSRASPFAESATRNLMGNALLPQSPSQPVRERRGMNARRKLKTKALDFGISITQGSPGGSGSRRRRKNGVFHVSANLGSTLGQPAVW